MSLLSALQRQKEIYTAGFSGRRPLVPTDSATLAQKAKDYCSEKAYAYIAGGAGPQDTIDNNRRGLRGWSIVPQMLRDVSERDLSITLLGRKLPSPLLAAPIGVLDLVHPEGDLAVARACARLGVPMIYSNQASFAMEDCAAEMADSPRWFQLYWSKSDALVQSFLSRAEQCGGANAVCLGRPYVYGRAIDGQLGVEAVFRNIIAEFELTMGLSGCRQVADISPNLLKRTQHYG